VSAGWLAGLGTFAAIALHKPLDALSIGSVMTAAGRSPALRAAVNVGFSLMCPLGAAVFLLGVRHLSETQHLVTGVALGFSAGAFLCIALGDLLPELEFHSHDRVKLSAALLAGLAVAFVIERWGHPGVHRHVAPAASQRAL
jgi:zinc and cadmium transporter